MPNDDQRSGLLGSLLFRQAVAGIRRRAEKQTDWEKLEAVFVKSDLFDRVRSPDSQLVLGRRGTGKTHLIRVFQKEAIGHGELALYVDCTRLGSGFTGLSLPPDVIARKYFVSLLNQLGTDLLDEAMRLERPEPEKQNRIISHLCYGLVPSKPDGSDSLFNYRQISDSLSAVLRELNIDRLFLILDEWALIPVQAQPTFAEFIKRGLLSVPSVSLKLLAVNYQCQFSRRDGDDLVGLERGADIPEVLDIDRYLVFDEKRDYVVRFFAELLYNHLGAELGWPLDEDGDQKVRQVNELFTQSTAFTELVRAAEGNPRDFLCVFSRAYFD